MENAFALANVTLYRYGLIIAVGTLSLIGLMSLYGLKRGLPQGTVQLFGVLAIPLGLVGGRLLFCAFNLSLFLETYESPWLMLRFFDGGLSMPGVLGGMVLAAYITARMFKLSFGRFADTLTLFLGLWIAICRLGEGYTDLGVGKVIAPGSVGTALSFLFQTETIGISTEYRLKVYLLEAIAAFCIFLYMLSRRFTGARQEDTHPGDESMLFFSLYGASQVLLESLRDDGHMLITFLRVGQVLAGLLPIMALVYFGRRYLQKSGKADLRFVLCWVCAAVAIIVCILLEFSLDGRLAWGAPSALRDYAIMAVACVMLFAAPSILSHWLNKNTGN